MFEIENVSGYKYRMWRSDDHIGDFSYYHSSWCFELAGEIVKETNPNIFPFILKTLENLNNGVVYE